MSINDELGYLDSVRTAIVNVHWQNDIVTAAGAFAPYFAEPLARREIVQTTRAKLATVVIGRRQ